MARSYRRNIRIAWGYCRPHYYRRHSSSLGKTHHRRHNSHRPTTYNQAHNDFATNICSVLCLAIHQFRCAMAIFRLVKSDIVCIHLMGSNSLARSPRTRLRCHPATGFVYDHGFDFVYLRCPSFRRIRSSILQCHKHCSRSLHHLTLPIPKMASATNIQSSTKQTILRFSYPQL